MAQTLHVYSGLTRSIPHSMQTKLRKANRHLATAVFICGLLLVSACASNTSTPEGKHNSSVAHSTLAQTIYSDDGISELSAPAGWTTRPDFSPGATIRIAEDSGAAFLIVNSYLPGEIEATPISEFSRSYMQGLSTVLGNSRINGEGALEVNGTPAYRFVITGDVDGIALTYVSTVISGRAAMHHLVGWVAASDYGGESNVLNKMIASFRESSIPRPPRQRITLSFGWPDSLQSAVSVEQKSVKRGKATELNATYLSTVHPGSGDELVVSTRVMRQKLSGLDNGEQGNYVAGLLDQLSAEVPDYVVSRDGEFIRVDNLTAYQKRVEAALVSNLPTSLQNQKDSILAMVKSGLTEKFLSAAATDDWNKTVGGWAGSSYVPGQTYRFSEQYYAPLLGEMPFTMDVSRRIAGFAPCTATEPQCVKLVLTATVAGDDFRSAMSAFLEKSVGQPVNVKHVSVIRKVEIVAEPDTLIPHRTHSIKETTVIIEDSHGNARTSRETEDTRATYSYESLQALR